MIRTVLFDLDGTLLDTAPDLAYALNQVRQEHGKTALPYETIRPVVSHGGKALIKLGFALDEGSAEFDGLRQRLLDIYRENLAVHTALFPGTDELLQSLRQNHIQWGVVTNKPAWLTEPLMQALELDKQCACIVSGDTTTKRKPDPEPMLYACHQTGSHRYECLYVGDAQRDIQAGKSAGMKTLTALYGYISEQDQPDRWDADGMIRHPMEILEWIDRFNHNEA